MQGEWGGCGIPVLKFFVRALEVSYVAFVLSLLVPHLILLVPQEDIVTVAFSGYLHLYVFRGNTNNSHLDRSIKPQSIRAFYIQ